MIYPEKVCPIKQNFLAGKGYTFRKKSYKKAAIKIRLLTNE